MAPYKVEKVKLSSTTQDTITEFFKTNDYKSYDYGQAQRNELIGAVVAFKKQEAALAKTYGPPNILSVGPERSVSVQRWKNL